MDEETKTDTKKKEKRIDLSLAQVAGSALAAAAAAYLAGRLGVYGTIIGAGVVSVVATTGGSIFQHLFRRTGEQLKEATVTTRPKPRRFSTTTRSTTGEAHRADPTMVLPTFDKQGAEDDVTSVAARKTGPGTDRTQLIPRAEAVHRRDPAGAHPLPDADGTRRLPGRAGAEGPVPSADADGFADAYGSVDSVEAGGSDETRVLRPAYAGAQGRPTDRTQMVPRLDARAVRQGGPVTPPADATVAMPGAHPAEEVSAATYGTRLRGWKRPALGALAVFVLAMGAVTATELITGQTPSGDKGTTLSNITHTGGSGRHQPDLPQSPDPGHSTGDGTRGGSDEPSPDPSTSGKSGTDPDRGTKSPSPTPTDGGKTSPDPDSSPSTGQSPDDPTGTGGDTGDGSTGDQDGGAQQNPNDSDAQQAPAPDAS
ncbi:hypothetical protein [Streptomyces sp. NPDC048248]|uniref:hypothetical protein n=1 Tax=Streptomyces sp. NPDC048248 TaxID=3365523 RepID=UPI00371B8BBF